MKKSFVITGLVLISALLYYFFVPTLDQEEETVLIKESIKKNSETTKKIQKVLVKEKVSEVQNKKLDNEEFAKYIDQVEGDWNKSIEDLFLEDPETAKKYLREYKKLKTGYEVERERRYEEFHLMMEEKHGADYSYSPSVDEEMFNEKLVKAYEKSLSEIIGDQKMKKYMSVKDNFNRKLEDSSKSSKNNDSFLLIEF